MPEWLTLDQAAARVQLSARTLRRAIQRGDLRAYRVGGRIWRLRPADVDAYIEAQLEPVEFIQKNEERDRLAGPRALKNCPAVEGAEHAKRTTAA
jgi:excisionase family DNA binding protein